MYIEQKEETGRECHKLRLSVFARKLLAEWKRLRLPENDQRIVLAVSGGADSASLLLALDELVNAKSLANKITMAHLNHGLRKEQGELDAVWVSELAHKLGHEIVVEKVDVRELASRTNDNLEQSARRARYRFLSDVAGRVEASIVLTAHTMEDQAETVLLRLMRGSGVDGLGGIHPVRTLNTEKQILLVRPLLRWARRSATESYCHEREVDYRSDAMNEDESFNRVRVRKQLLPLMATFNPRIVETLSRTAIMLQTDLSALQMQVQELLQRAGLEDSNGSPAIRVDMLALANVSVRRRALRQWITRSRGSARRLEHVHLLAVEKLIFGEQGGRVAELPGGSFVKRSRGELHFFANDDTSMNS